MPSSRPAPYAIRFPEVNGKDTFKDTVKAIAARQGKTANQFMVEAIQRAIAESQSDGQSVL